mmetsp:Transcript_44211/g.96456  ORF Transcript_44211/g.96456 Transcript_44211/m.96456 type:complete len:201 (+) Transcript_44211:216-818(+)
MQPSDDELSQDGRPCTRRRRGPAWRTFRHQTEPEHLDGLDLAQTRDGFAESAQRGAPANTRPKGAYTSLLAQRHLPSPSSTAFSKASSATGTLPTAFSFTALALAFAALASLATFASFASLASLSAAAARALGLWQETLKRKKLHRRDVQLVPRLKRRSSDAFSNFNAKVNLLNGAKNIIDLANLALAFQVDHCVEIRNL